MCVCICVCVCVCVFVCYTGTHILENSKEYLWYTSLVLVYEPTAV